MNARWMCGNYLAVDECRSIDTAMCRTFANHQLGRTAADKKETVGDDVGEAE